MFSVLWFCPICSSEFLPDDRLGIYLIFIMLILSIGPYNFCQNLHDFVSFYSQTQCNLDFSFSVFGYLASFLFWSGPVWIVPMSLKKTPRRDCNMYKYYGNGWLNFRQLLPQHPFSALNKRTIFKSWKLSNQVLRLARLKIGLCRVCTCFKHN